MPSFSKIKLIKKIIKKTDSACLVLFKWTYFTAINSPVLLFNPKRTLPNEPCPKVSPSYQFLR